MVSGLSQQGYIKATTIMSLEKVLYEMVGGRLGWKNVGKSVSGWPALATRGQD